MRSESPRTLLQSDGSHFLLTYERQPIAQTVNAEWAVPIEAVEMLTILPCGAEPLVRPLRFAQPRPVYSPSERRTSVGLAAGS